MAKKKGLPKSEFDMAIPKFMKDMAALQKKHNLSDYQFSVHYTVPPVELGGGGCDDASKVLVHDPVTHKICLKCPGDMTPCP